jgi:hypothetical protein
MYKLRTISQILTVAALALALYDAVYQWIVNKVFKIRTIHELWADIGSEDAFKSGSEAMNAFGVPPAFFGLSAPVAVLVVAGIFYAVYRIWQLFSPHGRAERL